MNKKEQKILHTLVKVSDLGSQDLFTARMRMQILEIRDFVFSTEEDRREFDKFYGPVLQNLIEARIVMEECVNLLVQHRQKIKSGEIVKVENQTLRVDESIDDNLNIWFKDFFIRGYIANQNIIRFAKFLDFKISFIFKSDSDFDKESKKFLENNPSGGMKFFIDMVKDDREKWFSQFIDVRTQIEHSGFQLPCIEYHLDSKNQPIGVEPRINDLDIPSYLSKMWENLFPFCEDIIVFLLAFKLPKGLVIKHIPEKNRDSDKPVRYTVVPRSSMPQNVEKQSFDSLIKKHS